MASVPQDYPSALKRIRDLENHVQELTADRDAWEEQAYWQEGEAYQAQKKAGTTRRTELGWHYYSDWWQMMARSLGYESEDDDPLGKGKKSKKGKGKGGKGRCGKGKGTNHGNDYHQRQAGNELD